MFHLRLLQCPRKHGQIYEWNKKERGKKEKGMTNE
jgi:hypothetical protein